MTAALEVRSPIFDAFEQNPVTAGAQEIARWKAHLRLHFETRPEMVGGKHSGVRTVLRYLHQGPLRIQKALYPEGSQRCHAVVVHPPGGIACADELQISARIDVQAQALILTPAATKWYGAFQTYGQAHQHVQLQVDGTLEWLPAETIVFDRARVASTLKIHVGVQGQMFGWDQLIFGRHESHERYRTGLFDQTLQLDLDDQTVWVDRLRLQGADDLFDSPVGFGGHHVCATAWAVSKAGEPFDDHLIESLRLSVPGTAVSRLHPRVLVMRAVGQAIDLRRWLESLWHWFRVNWLRQPAHPPRLWAT